MIKNLKTEWFGNVRGDILAGIVVCLALFPEVIGFMIVAGVDPIVGVYATFFITLISAFFGGRTGMISAAAGAVALVLANLVAEHGIEYLFATTILAGIIQGILGFLKIGKVMKYIPKAVMTGFVNSLGIMMFTSQLDHFKGNIILPILAIIGIFIIFIFPKITKKIPSPIVAILVISFIVIILKLDVRMLGDLGEISRSLPKFKIPEVPINFETLKIIFPTALSVALVGLIESLLTSKLVDEITESDSDKNREARSQGLANIVSGFFGGIAGCGMIGQTMINLNYGGLGRLATLLSGTFMLLSVVLLNNIIIQIPIVALAAVMVVVSVTTINWDSIKNIKNIPKTESLVMIITVIIVLLTHNLAYGVVIGTVVNIILEKSKKNNINVEESIV